VIVTMTGPLSGVRVLDLTSTIMGPYSTQILGDMGADVIKVEAPEGDVMRGQGSARAPGMGPVHLALNRNKRSLVLDLQQESARRALLRLARTSDVFVHSMRPGAIARLGLGYEQLREINARIVYCRAVGFGADGPYAERPGYDDLMQGLSGMCALNTVLAGEPRYTPTAIADKAVGLTVAYALLGALYHAQRTGQGQCVEVPMFESMVSFLMVEHLGDKTYDFDHGDFGYPRLLSPKRKPFATKDGHLCVLPFTDRHWRDFAALVGRPDWATDARLSTVKARGENFELQYSLMAEALRERPSAEWLADMERLSIPAAPAVRMADVFADPHLSATKTFTQVEQPTIGKVTQIKPPVTFSATPSSIRRPAPRLGEHSEEILREAGLTESEIAEMKSSGACV
jgi:formyl-CoA transferase